MLAKFPKSETVSALVSFSGVSAEHNTPLMNSLSESIRLISDKLELQSAPTDQLAQALNTRSERSVTISGLAAADQGQSLTPIGPAGPSSGISRT